ncbi:hypothetical protein BC831DRAFT_395289 [Entophlyctis helioformis]|nr:hypothetical protein BC831DRAFT_395289 [Entophlyctis helioformis]
MTYATGKANEALVQLTQHLISTLKPFTLPTHQFSQHAVTAALQTDIARLLQIAESNSPPNGPAIDPFLLRNEVAAFDETKLCDNVQKQAERIVQRQLVTQLAVYASAVLATHLGVPFAISLPSAILASGLGFSWMNLRWSSAQRRYLGRIGESQKVLKDTLTTAYDNEFARVVAAPLAVSVKMISEAIQQRAQDAANANKAIEDLAQTIKREIEQRGDSA